jgi:four helix bundle protein
MARPPAQRFEDLVVWQKSHALVLRVYQATRKFPREETYGLTAQCRRAAVSVAANIAEGFKKRGRADKARFMNMAEASLEETRYYFVLATDLGYPVDPTLIVEIAEVARMLSTYADAILRSAQQQPA